MTTGHMVEVGTTHGTLQGYLAGAGPNKPGLIVIQEWWGLVPHIKSIADRLALAGYIAIAPDLYHGKSTVAEEEAKHLLNGLDWTRAIDELIGAATYLRQQQHVPSVGVVGFCVGGALAVLAAARPEVNAYVPFYGFPPQEPSEVGVPGLFFFGADEDHFPVPKAQAFAERQRERRVPTDVVIYPDAGHAFFNDTRPEKYRRTAAIDAWNRTLDFFRLHLPKA